MAAKKITRRSFMAGSSALLAAYVASACSRTPEPTAEPAAPTSAPAAPAAPGAPTTAPAAPAAPEVPSSWAEGPVLTDMPVGPGEREVQQQVYNSPAAYEAATGNKITGFYEAPELADMVANGDLPPVAERLPAEPVVIQPEETVGKYGGTFAAPIEGQNRAVAGASSYLRAKEYMTTWSPHAEIIPNVAQSWALSEDATDITFTLRDGIKWSDGTPFSADDVMYWYENILLNDELYPTKPTVLTRSGELVLVTKVDDQTVTFSFADAYPLFITYLASWGGPGNAPVGNPKHYLSQFHTDFVDMADIEKGMEDEGFDEWSDFYNYMASDDNPEKPVLFAWIPNERPPQSIQTYRRNPYYWKIDTAGNQLPYMDGMRTLRMADTEATMLKTIAGELDWTRLVLAGGVPNLDMFMQYQQEADYRFVYGTWMPNSFCNIMFNFSHPEPAKKELYNDVNFRRGLSSAINREEIVKLVWKGGVFPSQVAPLYGPPYNGESELFQSYAAYDPDLANSLLDEAGLTERDSDGYRLGLDGEQLLLVISATTSWPQETPEVMDLVKGYWDKVGIRASVKPEAGDLWNSRHGGGEHDISARGAHFGGGPVHPTLNSNTFCMSGWQWAPEWAKWIDTNGEQGEEPPDGVKRIREIREEVLAEPSEEKRVELIMEVFQIHMDNLWSLGIVVDDPRIYQSTIVKNRVRNVPTWTAGEWYPNVPCTWFINE